MIPIPVNAAHWHIVLVHYPMAGLMASLVVLGLATCFKDVRWQRVALAFMVATAALTAASFLTGEDAEHIVEGLPGIEDARIHEHEELAETARNIMIPFALLVIALWWLTRRHTLLPIWMSGGLMLAMLVLLVLLMNVASLGGKIHHPEIRGGEAALQQGHVEEDDED